LVLTRRRKDAKPQMETRLPSRMPTGFLCAFASRLCVRKRRPRRKKGGLPDAGRHAGLNRAELASREVELAEERHLELARAGARADVVLARGVVEAQADGEIGDDRLEREVRAPRGQVEEGDARGLGALHEGREAALALAVLCDGQAREERVRELAAEERWRLERAREAERVVEAILFGVAGGIVARAIDERGSVRRRDAAAERERQLDRVPVLFPAPPL